MDFYIPKHGKLGFVSFRAPLVLVASLVLFCLPAVAQLNLGRIFGGITDQSGGAIVGATVTVVDVARGISRPLVSDAAGEYSAPSLTPGMYSVRAEAKGFKVVERTDILVGVGQDVRVDLTLQPGEQNQTITVTGELPMVNTSNAMLGGTLENQMIDQLPTNGRDYTQLLSYKPGILQIPGAGSNAFISNGAGFDMNVWLFDGIYDCNPLNSDSAIVGGGFVSGAQANILPLDAIQEVNVIENPSAEYGWKHGAIVNTGLKSGTNTIHGTAFASGRDDAMDAKNAFLGPTQTKALDNIEQFGATVGGPIKKDKLFYFGAYEGQRLKIGVPILITVPTLVSVGGTKGTSQSFPDAIADMIANHHPISQLSLNLAGCTSAGVCNPATSLFGGNTQGASAANPTALPVAFNNQGGSNNALEKIDYHPNDHNAINGEYFFGQGLTLYGGAITEQWWRTGYYQRVNVARGVWVWTPNSSWVNEMRFGLDRINFPVFTDECQGANFQAPAFNPGPNYATQYGLVTGAPVCGFPTLTISGFTALGMPGPIQTNVSTIYSGQDSVSYTRGKHLFKFGGEIHDTLWNGAAVANGRGALAFGTTAAFTGATAIEDFLSGELDSGSTKTRVLAGTPARNIDMNMYALFVQDDWRVTPRLTVNLGVRWEIEPPITDRNNLLGNFNPSTPSGLDQAGIGGVGSEVYKASLGAVGPRFGLVWDVFGKGRTVVRAGSSIVYETPALLNLISNPQGASLNSVPTGFTLINASGTQVPSPGTIEAGTIAPAASALNWAVGTPVFNTSPSGLVCSSTSPCVISVINPNFRRSKEINYTLGIQHAFTNNLSLNLSYIGNDALGLSSAVDINQPTAGSKTGEQQRRPYYNQFPYLGNIFYYTYSGQSIYQGMQASLTERVIHGLNFTVGYTYQNALEDSNGEQQNAPPMDSYNPLLDWGESRYGAHQHLSLAGTYVIPGKKSPGQMLEGWQVNSAVTLLTGFPINALDSTSDISGTGEAQDRWTMVGPARNFQVGPAPIPCFGAAGSSFGKAGCAALPAACIAAATNEPNGPSGPTDTGIASLNTLGCYMEGNSVIVPPAQGTYGTMSKDGLFSKPFREWDFSVSKNWKFKERVTAQFRAEFFNILNRTAYAVPTLNPNSPANFGLVAATPNTGSPAVGSGSPRLTQLELKFIF